MNSRPILTIIVPVYNVEKYLDRCISSIINQTLKKIEIILIDDGSTDNSGVLCDKWLKIDQRIQVIHKINGGLSSARNVGLQIAKGQYVTFLDSDDWIVSDTCEYALKLLSLYNADVIQYDIFMCYKENTKIPFRQERINIYEGKEIIQYYLETTTNGKKGYSVCQCVFRTALAKRYKFREGKINEDIDYKYKVLRDSDKFVVSNQLKYIYFQSGNSISSGALKRRDFQLREAGEELMKLTQNETYGTIAFLGKVKAARTAFSLLSRAAVYGINDSSINEKETIALLLKEHRKNIWILLKSPIPISRKLLAIMLAINFYLTRYLIIIVKLLWK